MEIRKYGFLPTAVINIHFPELALSRKHRTDKKTNQRLKSCVLIFRNLQNNITCFFCKPQFYIHQQTENSI